jgi:hypothetical protein
MIWNRAIPDIDVYDIDVYVDIEDYNIYVFFDIEYSNLDIDVTIFDIVSTKTPSIDETSISTSGL